MLCFKKILPPVHSIEESITLQDTDTNWVDLKVYWSDDLCKN